MLQLSAVSLALQSDAFETCRNAPPSFLRQATMTVRSVVCAVESVAVIANKVIDIKKRRVVRFMASPFLNGLLVSPRRRLTT